MGCGVVHPRLKSFTTRHLLRIIWDWCTLWIMRMARNLGDKDRDTIYIPGIYFGRIASMM